MGVEVKEKKLSELMEEKALLISLREELKRKETQLLIEVLKILRPEIIPGNIQVGEFESVFKGENVASYLDGTHLTKIYLLVPEYAFYLVEENNGIFEDNGFYFFGDYELSTLDDMFKRIPYVCFLKELREFILKKIAILAKRHKSRAHLREAINAIDVLLENKEEIK